jgi:hypothetical protein
MPKAAELHRLTPNDTLVEAAAKLVDGNPGAAHAVAALIHAASAGVDPGQPFGPHGPLFALDELELYGPDIWCLFKDVCGQDALLLTALLRGWRLGLVRREQLVAASRRAPTPLGVAPLSVLSVLAQVMTQLPRFGRPHRGRAALLDGKVLR